MNPVSKKKVLASAALLARVLKLVIHMEIDMPRFVMIRVSDIKS